MNITLQTKASVKQTAGELAQLSKSQVEQAINMSMMSADQSGGALFQVRSAMTIASSTATINTIAKDIEANNMRLAQARSELLEEWEHELREKKMLEDGQQLALDTKANRNITKNKAVTYLSEAGLLQENARMSYLEKGMMRQQINAMRDEFEMQRKVDVDTKKYVDQLRKAGLDETRAKQLEKRFHISEKELERLDMDIVREYRKQSQLYKNMVAYNRRKLEYSERGEFEELEVNGDADTSRINFHSSDEDGGFNRYDYHKYDSNRDRTKRQRQELQAVLRFSKAQLEAMMRRGDRINGVKITQGMIEAVEVLRECENANARERRLRGIKKQRRSAMGQIFARNTGEIGQAYYQAKRHMRQIKVTTNLLKTMIKVEAYSGRYVMIKGQRLSRACAMRLKTTAGGEWIMNKRDEYLQTSLGQSHSQLLANADALENQARERVARATANVRQKRNQVMDRVTGYRNEIEQIRRMPADAIGRKLSEKRAIREAKRRERLKKMARKNPRRYKRIMARRKAKERVTKQLAKIFGKKAVGSFAGGLLVSALSFFFASVLPVVIIASVVMYIILVSVTGISTIFHFLDSLTGKKDLKDLYEYVIDKEQELVENEIYKSDGEISKVTYYVMDNKGNWVLATKTNNAKQIISMACTVFDDQYKEDGQTYSRKTYRKLKQYCDTLIEESISTKASKGEKTFCSEEQIELCNNTDADGKCKGHATSELKVYMYGFMYGDFNDKDESGKKYEQSIERNMGEITLFSLDNEKEGYYDYLSKEKKAELRKKDGVKRTAKEVKEDGGELVKTKTLNGVYCTVYCAVGDKLNGTWGRATASGRNAVAYSDKEYYTTTDGKKYHLISSAVDKDLFGKDLSIKKYFFLSGFNSNTLQPDGTYGCIFRADDTGSAIKGKHVDIFTYDANETETANGIPLNGHWSARGKTLTIAEGLSGFESTGNDGTYWDKETIMMAVAKCSMDWKELYGIDTGDYSFETAIENLKQTENGVNEVCRDSTTINKEKNVSHIIAKRKQADGSYAIQTKTFDDTYANKVQYTLVKWALSRNNTCYYSQDNRYMKKNPTKNAGCDCTGFLNWVVSKTQDELKLKKEETLSSTWGIWKGAGFSKKGNIQLTFTSDSYKPYCNITKKGGDGKLSEKELMAGDLLIRGITSKYHGTYGNVKSNNHGAVFLGYSGSGYYYMDCTSRTPAIQKVFVSGRDVLSSSGNGHEKDGLWGGAIRLVDYNKLNHLNSKGKTVEKENYLYATQHMINSLKEIETKARIDYTPWKKEEVIRGQDYWKFRKYKKYGGEESEWKINLNY